MEKGKIIKFIISLIVLVLLALAAMFLLGVKADTYQIK